MSTDTILAKFKVGSVEDHGNNNIWVKMSPVTGEGSEENKSFSKYTPGGDVKLFVTNPEVIGFFKPGNDYYLEFKKV